MNTNVDLQGGDHREHEYVLSYAYRGYPPLMVAVVINSRRVFIDLVFVLRESFWLFMNDTSVERLYKQILCMYVLVFIWRYGGLFEPARMYYLIILSYDFGSSTRIW